MDGSRRMGGSRLFQPQFVEAYLSKHLQGRCPFFQQHLSLAARTATPPSGLVACVWVAHVATQFFKNLLDAHADREPGLLEFRLSWAPAYFLAGHVVGRSHISATLS